LNLVARVTLGSSLELSTWLRNESESTRLASTSSFVLELDDINPMTVATIKT
jgi:hypothetical protein